MARTVLAILCAAILLTAICGCRSKPGPGHDLDVVMGKVSAGMSEVQVVANAGTPDRIEAEGDYRKLRYYDVSGTAYVEITLKNNVVVDIIRRD